MTFRTQAIKRHLAPYRELFCGLFFLIIYMITPDIRDESLWVIGGNPPTPRIPDPHPLCSHGTPIEYVPTSLPSTTDGIDWISPRDDHDFMWGYH